MIAPVTKSFNHLRIENRFDATKFACLDNTMVMEGLEISMHYYSVPIWTLKFEIVFIFLHMGMHKNGIDGHTLYVNY